MGPGNKCRGDRLECGKRGRDPMTAPTRALRGRLLSFRDDPATAGTGAYTYIEDGLVLVAGGDILDVGEARALLSRVPETVAVDHFPDALILPGFIDAHIHFPQTQVIASYGAQLMDWLERYALVEEQRFAEPKHSVAVARFFLDELARNRSEEHTSELQSLMRNSYAVFCLQKK